VIPLLNSGDGESPQPRATIERAASFALIPIVEVTNIKYASHLDRVVEQARKCAKKLNFSICLLLNIAGMHHRIKKKWSIRRPKC
jgi:hypothetical protein